MRISLPGLNESPYEKVGKYSSQRYEYGDAGICLNESPYEKVGKYQGGGYQPLPPVRLNESPYEKVGKCDS